MALSQQKLYAILMVLCLTGMLWVGYQYQGSLEREETITVCLIKHATNLPCPSCGSTRALMHLLRGEVWESLYINPLGWLMALVLFILPGWIIYDVLTRKDSLFTYFRKAESWIRRPAVAVPLGLLVIANWIWNILKEL